MKKSAIFPPLKNTSEPVISPPDLKINLLFELEIAFWVKPNPAISPVPFTVSVPPIVVLPSNKALEPVMSPSGVTWKLDDDIKKSAEAFPSKWNEPSCCNFVPLISKPAIFPPLKRTCEPVIFPVWSTLKALELIKRFCVESFISTPVVVKLWPSKVNPPIFPPVNKTDEPVILPLPFTLKLGLLIKKSVLDGEPDIKVVPLFERIDDDSIKKPPIEPALALIVPSNKPPLAIRIPLLSTIKLGPILI